MERRYRETGKQEKEKPAKEMEKKEPQEGHKRKKRVGSREAGGDSPGGSPSYRLCPES